MGLHLKQGRSCGDCTACCTVLEVPEIAKQKYTPCANVCAAGCAIHSMRPTSCRTWNCAWLSGLFRQRDRPDKSGVIAWPTTKMDQTLIVVLTGGGPLSSAPIRMQKALLKLCKSGWNLVEMSEGGERVELFHAPGRKRENLGNLEGLITPQALETSNQRR